MAGSISGISSASTAAYPVQGGKRPDPSEAFSKLDTGNKGYIDAADLEQASPSQDGKGPSAGEVLKTLDTSGDGKITKEEFTDGAKKLGEQLHAQFDQSRVDSAVAASGAAAADQADSQGGASGASAGGETGAGASATGTTASSSASKTYEAADTNEDGSVSEKERLAYEQKTQAAQQAYQQAAASFESQSFGSLQTAA
ncbi:EF-hand domain-containing protein [Oxalobacteraceae bacterium A2-2]